MRSFARMSRASSRGPSTAESAAGRAGARRREPARAQPSARSKELDARPEVPEPPGFETTRRAGLDDAAVVGTHLVEEAGKAPRGRHVERGAPFAGVLHETPAGGPRVEDREPPEELG